MVRRTREDALATRSAIIAAARDVFYHNGVSRTSLDQIAKAAGVTRGAIYWHFEDKAQLFYAMRDEVRLPLVDRSHQSLTGGDPKECPLDRIERFIVALLDGFASDEAVRRTLWIMTFECEYVGEFARDLDNACHMHDDLKQKLTALYAKARRSGVLRADVTAARAATDTVIFVAGLIRLYILDESGTLMRPDARKLIADHVRGKRGATPAGPRVSRAAAKS